MKRAVSVSLGSPSRNKKVVLTLNGVDIEVERIGTGGDVAAAQKLYAELDGKVDCLSVGGVDLRLPLGDRWYPLRSAMKLIKDVHQTPVVDGSGLKHTLERRVFELARPQLGEIPHFKNAFIPMIVDRLGLGHAVAEVADEVVKLLKAALAQIVCMTEAEGGKDVAAGLVAVDAQMHEWCLVTSFRGFAQGGLELLGENGRGAGSGNAGAARARG